MGAQLSIAEVADIHICRLQQAPKSSCLTQVAQFLGTYPHAQVKESIEIRFIIQQWKLTISLPLHSIN